MHYALVVVNLEILLIASCTCEMVLINIKEFLILSNPINPIIVLAFILADVQVFKFQTGAISIRFISIFQ